MVSVEPPSPSRAGDLPLVGSELAFDLTNTSSGRGGPMHKEHLLGAEDVVAWARQARVLTPADGQWLAHEVVRDMALAQALMERIRDLREVIYAIGAQTAAGGRPAAADADLLARIYADCVARARLVPHGAGFVWTWDPRQAPVEAVLGPIALSALTLLTQADLSRIKQCQGDHCGWLFFDTTKNKRRRWCEMEVCGNRAKQRRHQSRRAASPREG
jgi:predicted RNA-binding Zn ribbon-like protein